MKKHIFLLQIHKQPALIDRILKKLSSPNHYFIVNVDKKSSCFNQLMNTVSHYDNIIDVTDFNVMHGAYSQIDCTLKQICIARAQPMRFDYYHTLSGQDYPIVTMESFDSFFEHNYNSYMYVDSTEECLNWRKTKYKERLEHFYFQDVFNTKLLIRLKVASIARALTYWIPRKYNGINSVWGGGIGLVLQNMQLIML